MVAGSAAATGHSVLGEARLAFARAMAFPKSMVFPLATYECATDGRHQGRVPQAACPSTVVPLRHVARPFGQRRRTVAGNRAAKSSARAVPGGTTRCPVAPLLPW